MNSRQITAFRGAISAKLNHEYDLFHNHQKDGRSIYRYPLIQYKMHGVSPSIIGINEGSKVTMRLFEEDSNYIDILKRRYELKVGVLDYEQLELSVGQGIFTYRLSDWLPLNQTNNQKYIRLSKREEQLAFLERMLIGNIWAFAKGIGWWMTDRIEIKSLQIRNEKKASIKKGVSLICFDAFFQTNILLPNYIGIGKGASKGFGVIERMI